MKKKSYEACSELWMAVFLRTVADALHRNELIRSRALSWLFDDMYVKDRKIIGDRAGIDIDTWQTDLRRVLIDKKDVFGDKIEMSAKKLQTILVNVLKRHGAIIE